MGYKVKTAVNLTPEQLVTLQHFGCKPMPYITWNHEWVFAAYCEDGQEQELRNLEYVTSVEQMPTYQVA
jgi:hypothetical protein